MKKKQSKNTKKTKNNASHLDDHFTKFLSKKMKKLNKKRDRIQSLEARPASELSKLQVEMVEKKDSINTEWKFFDDVLSLYTDVTIEFKKQENTSDLGKANEKSQKNPSDVPQIESNSKSSAISDLSSALGNLATVGTYFNTQDTINTFGKNNTEIVDKYGSDFIPGVVGVWKTIVDNQTSRNEDKNEIIRKEILSYVSKSNLLSVSANLPFSLIAEGVDAIANSPNFMELKAQPQESLAENSLVKEQQGIIEEERGKGESEEMEKAEHEVTEVDVPDKSPLEQEEERKDAINKERVKQSEELSLTKAKELKEEMQKKNKVVWFVAKNKKEEKKRKKKGGDNWKKKGKSDSYYYKNHGDNRWENDRRVRNRREDETDSPRRYNKEDERDTYNNDKNRRNKKEHAPSRKYQRGDRKREE